MTRLLSPIARAWGVQGLAVLMALLAGASAVRLGIAVPLTCANVLAAIAMQIAAGTRLLAAAHGRETSAIMGLIETISSLAIVADLAMPPL